jgi:acetyltransferase
MTASWPAAISDTIWRRAGNLNGGRVRNLDRLLRPRSVAVVGASPNPSFVSWILKNLLRYGYPGSVVAVNPRYPRVLDAPCYPSVLEVPEPLDLVVVGVAQRSVPAVLEQCAARGVGAVDIVSSGFAEMSGGEGRRRQAELADWAARTGIPVAGPNCLGLMNATIGMVALPTVFENLIPGAVGAVLQSGMMAPSVLVPLLSRSIGLTVAVTTGNEADLETADYIEYLAHDEATRVIACFTEQFKTPERFVAACEAAAARGKPIVMLKIGRSEGGRRAALAHTGSLVGADGVVDAVLGKLGVTRVRSVDELLEAVAVFHARTLPRGSGVGAVIVSGGAVGLLSDLGADCGVSFPPLPEATATRLRTVVPEYGSVGNPLDITGQGVYDTAILEQALDAMAEAGNVDVIVYARGFPSRLDRQTPAGRIIEQAVARHPDVLFLVLGLVGGHLHAAQNPDYPVAEPTVHLDGVPFLQGSEAGLRAVAALVRYAAFQRERARAAGDAARRLTPASVAAEARARLAGAGGVLTERESKAVLALYGIPVTRERLATTPEEARAAADAIGYPVALKVESPDLPHKTEAGALLLDVRDPAGVTAGFARVVASARRAAPAARIHGVLVQEMVEAGTEMIVGMSRDPQFGPIVACGLGGVFVETLRDAALLWPPVREGDARAALERLRGYPVLQGVRGAKPADQAALVDVVRRFAELCVDLGPLVEAIDINPLVVFEAGRGVCAVDCLIVPAARG